MGVCLSSTCPQNSSRSGDLWAWNSDLLGYLRCLWDRWACACSHNSSRGGQLDLSVLPSNVASVRSMGMCLFSEYYIITQWFSKYVIPPLMWSKRVTLLFAIKYIRICGLAIKYIRIWDTRTWSVKICDHWTLNVRICAHTRHHQKRNLAVKICETSQFTTFICDFTDIFKKISII